MGNGNIRFYGGLLLAAVVAKDLTSADSLIHDFVGSAANSGAQVSIASDQPVDGTYIPPTHDDNGYTNHQRAYATRLFEQGIKLRLE